MATNFPASLDSLTNPTSSDSLNSPSHSAQHANVNDAVEALQAKVGADSSAVTSSLDYKVAQLEAGTTADSIKSYADSAARTTAVPSPAEADLSYLQDTNSVEVYDGSAWSAISTSALTLITSVSWSSVTSVTLDNCFSSDYRNYMYQLEMPVTASTQHDIRMNYRSGGSNDTSGVYQNVHIYMANSGATIAANFLTGFTFHYMAVSSTSTCSDAFGYFYRPAISGSTTGMSQFGSGSSFAFAVGNNSTTSTTAYDGINLYHATGGTFSGTLRIFGVAS